MAFMNEVKITSDCYLTDNLYFILHITGTVWFEENDLCWESSGELGKATNRIGFNYVLTDKEKTKIVGLANDKGGIKLEFNT